MNTWQIKIRQLFTPLAYRDFLLLWLGQAISAFGNPFQTVALAWLVLELTGSALALATVMLALSLPQAAVTLVGGVLTDRLDARTVMLWTDFTRCLTSGALALLAWLNCLPLWLLGLILIIHGTANGLFFPASSSITPRLVPADKLEQANSLKESISQLGLLFGALPAGVVVAFGSPAFAFALNALSFGVAVVAAFLMRPLPRTGQEGPKNTPLAEVMAGFGYLKNTRWLIGLLLLDSCAALAAQGPIGIGLPLMAREVFGLPAEGYSLLLISFGLGTIIGLFLPTVVRVGGERGRVACYLQALEAVCLALTVFSPFGIAALLLLVMAGLNGMVLIFSISLIQTRVAAQMLGRIMSLLMLSSFATLPISQAAAGLVAGQFGIQVLFVGAGGIMLFGAIAGLVMVLFNKPG